MTNNYTAPTNDEERNKDFEETAQSFFSDQDAQAVGTQAATRTYSDYLSSLAQQEQTTKSAYSDIFQRSKMTNYQQQAAATPGFTGVSGGQVDQVSQAQSAAQVAQLGDIGMARTQALGEIETQRLAAREASLNVGQQAEQAVFARQAQELGLEDRQIAISQDKLTIAQDETVPEETRVSNLMFKYPDMPQEEAEALVGIQETVPGWWAGMDDWSQSAIRIGGGVLAGATSGAFLGAKIGLTTGPVGAGIGAVIGAVAGIGFSIKDVLDEEQEN